MPHPEAKPADEPKKSAFAVALGKRLQRASEDMGWTPEQTAERFRIPRSTWSSYANGLRTFPCRRLPEAARIFGKPMAYFLGALDPEGPSGREWSFLSLLRAMDDSASRDLFRLAQQLVAASERRQRRVAGGREQV